MTTLKAIIATLRLENMAALKNKNSEKRAIIGTVISDLLIDGKEPDENVGPDKAFAVLKSYRKGLDKGGDLQAYIDVLEPLLPAQLTKEQLSAIVTEAGLTNMGQAMKYFKQPENQYLLFEPSVLKECFN